MADGAKKDILAEWWVKWREADFTWDGLADDTKDKRLQGWVVADGLLREAENGRIYGQPILDPPQPVAGRPATLQDYWRADAAPGPNAGRLRSDDEMGAELVRVAGQPTYHIAHLPLAYVNGTPTGKADWPDDALDAIVHPRLLAASETAWEGPRWGRKIVGPDRDAQLQGGIWLKAAAHPEGAPLSLRHHLALIFGYCSFANAKFSGDAWFEGAAFSGAAGFEGAVFSGDAWFEGAAFSGDAWFDDAAFSGAAWFNGAAFSGAAGFEGAAFSGDVAFYGAAFSGVAAFNGAAFSGVAGFNGAAFSGAAGFEGAAFSGDAGFEGAAFSGDAGFGGAAFSGDAGFNGAAFRGDAAFERAAVSGEAGFDDAAFSGVARFEGAAFAKLANFTDARFAKTVSFARTVLGAEKPTTFAGKAAFIRTTFEGIPTFDDAVFQGDMDFTAAVFASVASFERITWPREAAHWHSAFDQALFRGTLSLTGAGLQRFAAFDGATFERGVQIDEASEAEAKKTFRAEREAAIKAADPETTKDARLRQLERGCRVLKLLFERAADKTREQILYRFELQARRAQSKLPPGEKTFSILYWIASDYGASMIRPFIALGVVIAAFACFYWLYGLAVGLERLDLSPAAFDPHKAAQAFEFSLINTFRPLSALTAEGFREGTLGARLLTHDDPTALGVRALSILQSLFALVLAFLFALAVRRRFQIS